MLANSPTQPAIFDTYSLIMIKRILLPISIAASLVFIGYVYLSLANVEKPFVSPLEAIPAEVSLVLVARGDSLAVPSYAMSDTSASALWPEWERLVRKLKQTVKGHAELDSACANNGFAICAGVPFQKNKWLLSVGLSQELAEADMSALLKRWSGKEASLSEFKNTSVFSVNDAGGTISCAFVSGCWVLSSAPSLLEQVILNSEKGTSILALPLFEKAWKTASKELPLHIFVNDEKGGWLALDPNSNGAFGNMLGYWFVPDSITDRLVIASTEGTFGIASALPASTVWIEAYAYPDFQSGWAMAAKQKQARATEAYWSQAWSALGDSCGCDLNEVLLSWRDNEWGTAFFDHQLGRSAVAFFKVADSLDALQVLRPLLKDSVVAAGNTVASFAFPEVWQRNFLLPAAVGGGFVTQVKNYLIVGPSQAVLSDLSVAITAEATLEKQAAFQTAMNVVKPNGGLWMFQTANASGWWPEALKAVFAQELFLSMHIAPAGADRFLVSTTSSAQRNRTLVEPAPAAEPEASVDEVVATDESGLKEQSWSVINHATKEKEVLVQEKDNTLVLKDQKGKVLWSKPLSGRITSEVTQVDALKNGKLQMVFSTAAQIFVLDRNGNPLKRFPIELSTPITAPVVVMDYDGTKSYRLLVGLENGDVQNFSIEGTATPGWNFAKNKSAVKSIVHEKRNGKDVLVVNGGERLLKRNGIDTER